MKKEMTIFRIVEKVTYNSTYFGLTLQHPGTLPEIDPGQFVEVLVKGEPKVMLRRPISIHDIDTKNNTLKLLIQIVGNGTRQLASLQVGDNLDMILPLGQGFNVEGDNVLLVGGGAGTAPLLLLARAFQAKKVTPTILLGGRSAALIPVQAPFAQLGILGCATEDGTLGERGMVTQHSLFSKSYDHIYTCGPTPMMKAVARYARDHEIPCEVSLENMMACGVGACLCCVVETDRGNKRVCKEGPVFNTGDLQKWMEK
jgi:dihydroorotate dehydrogenase electron transfer subunit